MTDNKKSKEKLKEDKEQKDDSVKVDSKKMKASKDKLLVDMKNLLQRTQANFENYRKQTEKRMSEVRQMASKNVLLQILPVLDNFELALKNSNTNQRDFTKGVQLIYSQLFTVLENQGVKKIKTENQEFNPYYHEALMKIASEKPENTIIEELQKGFMLNDKVIRPAKVKVSDGQQNNNKN